MARIIAFTVAAVCAGPVLAEEMVTGVYLQSTELCDQARKESLQAVLEAGNAMLTARGIEAIEYDCEFVQTTKATRSPAWLVQAICQEPGYVQPDVFSLTQLSPTQIDLVSVKPEEPDGGGGNGGSYFLCEGVSAP